MCILFREVCDLLETSEKYRLLIESLPDAFAYFEIITDSEGRAVNCVCLGANNSFEKMTGRSRNQLVGQKLYDIMPEADDIFTNLIESLGQVVASGESSRFELYSETFQCWFDIIAYRFEPQRFAVIIRDITVSKTEELRNRYLSCHDSLTGLFNRHFLETEMQRLDTSRQLPISVIIADINGLKLINDTYGYNEGDKLIRNAAAVLKEICRKEDIITRWGGDEFIVLLPQTPADTALEISERIKAKCQLYNERSVPFSISIGTASKNKAEEPLAKVQKVAEDRMYRHKLQNYREIKGALLKSVYRKLQEKSFETEDHIRRVRNISLKIGENLALPQAELNRLAVLVLLHDIGKIKIFEEILTKKGLLDNEEWETIKMHPEAGSRIARATEEFAHVADDILSHHERWNGSGYPRGLKGEEIPLLARIMAIADAYEVMTSGRPYRRALLPAAAIIELKRCAGSQFDPRLVEIFVSLLRQKS